MKARTGALLNKQKSRNTSHKRVKVAGQTGDEQVNLQDTRARKNRWKQVKDFIPVLWPVAATLVAALYTYCSDQARGREAKVTLLTGRETSELQARAQVFKDLLDKVSERKNSMTDRVSALESLEYNFHAVFNGRNLLQQLADDLAQSCGHKVDDLHSECGQEHLRLREIPGVVSGIQKSMIKSTMDKSEDVRCAPGPPGDEYYDGGLYVSDTGYARDTGYGRHGKLHRKPLYCRVEYKGDVHEIVLCSMISDPGDPKESIRVGMVVGGEKGLLPRDLPKQCSKRDEFEKICDKRAGDGAKSENQDEFCGTFALSAYGTPFSDNVGLADGHRIAVLLSEHPDKRISPDGGDLMTIEVVAFPDEFVPPGYKPTITVVDRMGNGH